jgi:non-specific serine/threonine protein kinase/serine/threonine-protein kinase
MFEIHDAIRDLPGSTSARRLLATRALEYLDSLNEQSRGDASLQKELASAYERVGDVLGYPYAANLGDKAGALQSYRKALAIREPLARADPKDMQLQQDLAGNYFRLAQVLETTGDFTAALDALHKTLPITEQLAAGSTDPIVADHLSGTYYFSAVIRVETGNPAEALKNYQHAASLRGVALQANPGNFTLRTHLAADYAGMAKCMELTHDLAHAIQMQLRAVTILEEVSQAHPDNATLSEYLGEGVNRLGTYEYEVADYHSAVETYRRAHQIFSSLLTADPKNTLAKSNFASSDIGIARSLVHSGTASDAVKLLQDAVNTFDEMSPQTSSNRYLRSGLANAYSALGEAHSALAVAPGASAAQRRAEWTKARSACEKSLALWTDKEKRGELENGERGESAGAARCVSKSEAGLDERTARQRDSR